MLYLVNVLSQHSGGGTSFDGPWYTQLFTEISDALTTVVDFIASLVYDFGLVLYYTGHFLLRIPSYLGFLPGVIVSVLLIGFGIAVTYMVIDRK